MTENEAYPCGRSYIDRSAATYPIGARVLVGPAYRGDGEYIGEGCEGYKYVVGTSGEAGTDYKIANHPEDDYTHMVYVARLTAA